MAGSPDFIKNVIDHVAQELTVSKIGKETFRFTGLDIKIVEDGIEVSMDD